MRLRFLATGNDPSSGLLEGVAYLWIALSLACCLRAFLFPTNHTVYHNYANAGRNWIQGTDTYDLQRDAQSAVVTRMSGYRYSPLVTVLFVPFSALPDGLGGALWRLLNFVCFFAAFAWYIREVLPGADSLGKKGLAALWLLILPLSLGSMNNGQANVLLMALLLAAGVAAVRDRWNLTTLFLAGACFLKIYPLAIALLMLLIYPRKLGWRFALALALGVALPFALQNPGYVWGQYDNWLQLLSRDDRRDFPLNQGYRDFLLLTRFFGLTLPSKIYLAIQLAAAAAVAGVCLRGRFLNWPKQHLIQTLLALGCSWMVVFGPSTESSTFILIAPALAWALVDAFYFARPTWSRATLVLVMAMFLTTFMATWFPGGRDWFYVLQPISAVLFFVERLLRSSPVSRVEGDVLVTAASCRRVHSNGDMMPPLPDKKETDFMSAQPLMSIVLPAFKEEDVLPLFHKALDRVLADLENSYRIEILYVDDGSPDQTLQVMKKLAAQDQRVRYLSLSRNFGKEAALLAGMEHARGEVVITLDTDLQHPPELIPTLLQKWREGFDVVLTTKEEDKNLGLVKRLTSKVFYKWMGQFSKLNFADSIADYCLLNRKAVDGLLRLREGHRFMRGMIQWLGYKVAKIQFLPEPRPAGQTKYNLLRLLALASDGIFSFSRVPLRIATYLGLIAVMIGLAHACLLALQLFQGSSTVSLSWSYLFIATFFLGGAILFCLGIIGEYLGRIFEQVKDRPVYLLKDQSPEIDLAVIGKHNRDAA